MNRFFIAGLFGAISIGAFAQSYPVMTCPFSDNFYLSGANLSILSGLSVSGNLGANKVNSTEFQTHCGNDQSVSDGTVTVTIGSDAAHECVMTILDGPYETNPTIQNANCTGGLSYIGMAHPTFTYDYTLKFSQA